MSGLVTPLAWYEVARPEVLAATGLPDGVGVASALTILVAMGAVTLALRALPFVALKVLKSSQLVGFLRLTMPVGVMMILALYAVRSQLESAHQPLALVVSLAVTLGVHAWRKDAAVSILVGTALYVGWLALV